MPYAVQSGTPGAFYDPGYYIMGELTGAGWYLPDELAAPYVSNVGPSFAGDELVMGGPALDQLAYLQAASAAATPEGTISANIRPLMAWDMESGLERPSGFSAPSYLTQEQFSSWDPFSYLGLAPEQTAALWEYARSNPSDPLVQNLAAGNLNFGEAYQTQQFYPGDPTAYLAPAATETGRFLADAINAGYDVGLTPEQAASLQSYVTSGGHFWREHQEEDTLSRVLQTITPIILALGGGAVIGGAVAGAGAGAMGETGAAAGGLGAEGAGGLAGLGDLGLGAYAPVEAGGLLSSSGALSAESLAALGGAGTLGAEAGLTGLGDMGLGSYAPVEPGGVLSSSGALSEASLAELGGAAGTLGAENIPIDSLTGEPSLVTSDYGVQEAGLMDRLGMAFQDNPLGTISQGLKLATAVGGLFGQGGLFGPSGGGALATAGAPGATGPELPVYPAYRRDVVPYEGDWLKYAQALPTQTGAEHTFFRPAMAQGGALADVARDSGAALAYQRGGRSRVTSRQITDAGTQEGRERLMNEVRALWQKTIAGNATPDDLLLLEELGGLAVRPVGRYMVPPEMRQARGGALSHFRGPGGGQDDLIDAKVSPGEFVIDADTVAALGDGSNDEGARRLDAMREEIRSHKRAAPKTTIPPKAKKPDAYLRKAT